jgi:hypothetical protein
MMKSEDERDQAKETREDDRPKAATKASDPDDRKAPLGDEQIAAISGGGISTPPQSHPIPPKGTA